MENCKAGPWWWMEDPGGGKVGDGFPKSSKGLSGMGNLLECTQPLAAKLSSPAPQVTCLCFECGCVGDYGEIKMCCEPEWL